MSASLEFLQFTEWNSFQNASWCIPVIYNGHKSGSSWIQKIPLYFSRRKKGQFNFSRLIEERCRTSGEAENESDKLGTRRLFPAVFLRKRFCTCNVSRADEASACLNLAEQRRFLFRHEDPLLTPRSAMKGPGITVLLVDRFMAPSDSTKEIRVSGSRCATKPREYTPPDVTKRQNLHSYIHLKYISQTHPLPKDSTTLKTFSQFQVLSHFAEEILLCPMSLQGIRDLYKTQG